MKGIVFIALLSVSAVSLAAQVNGYFRRDGTYIAPHMRSAPDGNPYNNFSSQGNMNPYTGQMGTVNPYTMQRPPQMYAPPPAFAPVQPLQPIQPMQPYQPYRW